MFNHRIGQVLATAAASALALAGLAALAPTAQAANGQLGDITSLTRDGDTFTVRSGAAALRVVVEDDSLVPFG